MYQHSVFNDIFGDCPQQATRGSARNWCVPSPCECDETSLRYQWSCDGAQAKADQPTKKCVGQVRTLKEFLVQRCSTINCCTVKNHTQLVFGCSSLWGYDFIISFCHNLIHKGLVLNKEFLVPFKSLLQVLRPLISYLSVIGNVHTLRNGNFRCNEHF